MASIYINPGHGEFDPGAVNPITKLKESNVAFAVGEVVEKFLVAVGHKVRIWQNDDLMGVINDANQWKADLFLSIHCNSFANSQANGTETFYHPQSSNGRLFAECLQNQMIQEFGLYNRGAKQMAQNLGVLIYTNMPAALAEMAFISNPQEERLLANETIRWGACLARGCTDYCMTVGL